MVFGPIEKLYFSEINFNDTFFDSLKEDYPLFIEWVIKKSDQNETAYCLRSDGRVEAFLYLKVEHGPINDIVPPIPYGIPLLKIGTFKINPHGSRLGERFIKIIFDIALQLETNLIYVTIFAHHQRLISMLEEFGFQYHGSKGREHVYLKKLREHSGNTIKDYPLMEHIGRSKYLISIYPDYHTQLFPDSILSGESEDTIIHDVSHTNSIHKIYLSNSVDALQIQPNDLIVFYRTSDIPGRAYYRAVATSLGIVEEVRPARSFQNEDEFVDYCKSYSLFDENTLRYYYQRNTVAIKFLYVTAFRRKVIRKELLEDVRIAEGRWVIVPLSDREFYRIIQLSNIDQSLFYNPT